MKAHDRRPSIQATLSSAGSSVSLSTATSVTFIMAATPAGTVKVDSPAVIVDATGGVVRYDWATGDTDTVGNYQAEWQVLWSDGTKQTFPSTTYHTVAVLADLDNA